MRLAVVIATNSDRSAGKVVSDVLRFSAALDVFRDLRKATDFPAGPEFPLLVLCPVQAEAVFRMKQGGFTVEPIEGLVESDESEPQLESESEPGPEEPKKKRARKRNPGDGQP
jgi:hypothetical protein